MTPKLHTAFSNFYLLISLHANEIIMDTNENIDDKDAISADDSTTPSSVSKLPKFWSYQPDVWFLQAKVQFRLRRITSLRMRYYHVLEKLPLTVASFVLDIIRNPPTDDP